MALMFEPLRKYATFRGRARRLEYWLWQLLMSVVFTGLLVWAISQMGADAATMTSDDVNQAIASGAGTLPFTIIAILSVALVLPSLAVTVRRLHDSDKSGWWLLIGFTGIGAFVLLIFYLLDGTRGPNRHGPDPKGRTI